MPIAANANNISFSIINTELVKTANSTLNLGNKLARVYANISGLTSQIRVSDFRNRAVLRSWGMSRSFYFFGSLSNQLPTNPLDYFPLLSTGDIFSVVQAGGVDNGWSDPTTRVYEYFMSYGTPYDSGGLRNIDYRKATWQTVNYNGTNLVEFGGFYSGDSTNFPHGTNYALTIKYYGPGPISGITPNTAVRLGISEDQYLLNYPRNEF